MKKSFIYALAPVFCFLSGFGGCLAGQVPHLADSPDIPISSHDRVYTADQSSNTVSIYDPSNNRLVGVLRLGDVTPQNLSPLYRGQLLVHGLGFSFDHKTLAIVSIGSNSVTFSTPRQTTSNILLMLADRLTSPFSRPMAPSSG